MKNVFQINIIIIKIVKIQKITKIIITLKCPISLTQKTHYTLCQKKI